MTRKRKNNADPQEKPSAAVAGESPAEQAGDSSPVAPVTEELPSVQTEDPSSVAPVSGDRRDAKRDLITIAVTALKLAAITGVAALLLSFFNSLTAPVIEKRLLAEKNEAVAGLFGSFAASKPVAAPAPPDPVSEILEITNADGSFAGWCVSSLPKGFGGRIELLVAISPDKRIIGVRVLSMSETAGVGTVIADPGFLGRFTGVAAGGIGDVDVISGATISSAAVKAGVEAAVASVDGMAPPESIKPEVTVDG